MSNVPVTSPWEHEVCCAMKRLQRNMATGLDKLSPASFDNGGCFAGTIRQLFTKLWQSEDVLVC